MTAKAAPLTILLKTNSTHFSFLPLKISLMLFTILFCFAFKTKLFFFRITTVKQVSAFPLNCCKQTLITKGVTLQNTFENVDKLITNTVKASCVIQCSIRQNIQLLQHCFALTWLKINACHFPSGLSRFASLR